MIKERNKNILDKIKLTLFEMFLVFILDIPMDASIMVISLTLRLIIVSGSRFHSFNFLSFCPVFTTLSEGLCLMFESVEHLVLIKFDD